MKILIVDDDLTSRTVLAGMLENRGHEVVATVNGAEALETLQRPDAPPLIILDWIMPEMDGLEVIHRVRALKTNRPPYIMMLTVKDDKANIITALEAGANDYLTKPFDAGELLARVKVGQRMIEMQDAQRKSEERFRGLVAQSPLSIQILAPSGKTIQVNQAFEKLWGVSFEQMGDYNILEDDQFRDIGLKPYLEKAFSGDSVDFPQTEFTPRSASFAGNKCIVQSIAYPIKDESGAVREVTIMHRDITERKRIEKSLRDSEVKYRSLVETTNTGYLILDSEGRVIDANQEYVRLTGHRELGEILGRRVLEWTAEYEKQKNAEALAQCMKTSLIRNLVIDYVDKNGQITPVEINATMQVTNGVPRIISLCRDITERKKVEMEKAKLEGQLHQAQKMDAIGQLTSGIAHDFNNQLTVIAGYAEILHKKLDDVNLKNKAEKILQTSGRSVNLIKNLMGFSRKAKLVAVPVNIHNVIEEIIVLLTHTIDKKIKLRQVFNAGSAMIAGDPSQIQNALLNLALNARDALPASGEIVFTTEVVDVKEVPMSAEEKQKAGIGRYLKICVIDNGTGMDDDVKTHLFEPFFTTKPAGKGTGMGLASVYGTVKSHKGVIDVKSKLGEGTEFSLFFPICDTDSMPDAERKGFIPRKALQKKTEDTPK